MKRRTLLLAAFAVPALAAWPERAVRVVVPGAPGDGPDTTARLFAQHLSVALGQPFAVENRAGAGGRVGTEVVSRAPADGYTLIMGNAGSHGINGALYRDLPYDVADSFAPISLLVEAPNVLVVNPRALPARSAAEVIAAARARPGALSFASGGPGSSAHLTMELLRVRENLDMVHVPFRGAGPGLTALVQGDPPVMFANLPNAMPFILRRELVPLAVTSRARSPDLPDVPTMIEAGVPDFETVAWYGLLAPAGTPAEVVARLHAECVRIGAREDVRAAVRRLGGEVVAGTPAAFHARIRADVARWRELAARTGVSLD